MKLSVTDVIRRGFENTIANWPLLVIRIAEGIVMFVVVIVAVLAAIVPLAMSIGLNSLGAADPNVAADLLLGILQQHWMVLVYVVALTLLVLIVLVALHSFIEAGCAAVYVDAERAVAGMPAAGRRELKVFTPDRWWSGAKRDWWPVFWIYNIAWTVAGLILLVPSLAMLAAMLLLRDNAGAAIAMACLSLAVIFTLLIGIGIITNIWCEKAIVVCVARLHRAPEALGEAWREFRSDPWRHIGVAVVLVILIFVGSGVFASISFVGGLDDSTAFALAMLPLQIAGSIGNTVFSTLMGAWFLACFAALSVDRR